MTSINVAAELGPLAREYAHVSALVTVDSRGRPLDRVSFSRLDGLVARCAGGLRLWGVERGDRVIVFVPMSVGLYVVLLALLRLGAVAVFIDPWAGRRVIDAAVSLVEPAAFVGVPKAQLLRMASPALRTVPLSVEVAPEPGVRARIARSVFRAPVRVRAGAAVPFEDLLVRGGREPVRHPEQTSGDDPALVTFTTGSTGAPKGANRTHAVLAAQHAALTNHIDQSRGDVHLTNLPIVVLHNLARGVTTVLPPASSAQDAGISGEQLHATVSGAGATLLTLSPAPLAALADGPSSLSKVRRIYTGGGPVLPEMLLRVMPVVPYAEIDVLYGSTEAEPIAHASARDVLDRRADVHEQGGIFVGFPVDEVRVRLVRPHDGPIELLPGSALADWDVEEGSPGEILVSGDHVNRDYYGDPDAVRRNKVTDEHGVLWHRTGDVARRGTDGGLWLLGRVGVDVRVGGATTYALEIEAPVSDLPEIGRAAICVPRFAGADREFKNAAAVLAVEPAKGFGRADARDAAVECLRRLGADRSIEVRTLRRIPMDSRHGAKVDTAALERRLKPSSTDDY